MPIEIKMPALSPTMEEGTLAKWLVKAGDAVKSGDLLAEIETDKATMEFEAVDEGVIASIAVPEGTDNVKVGTVIATLAGEGEAVAPTSPQQVPGAEATPGREDPNKKGDEGRPVERDVTAAEDHGLPPQMQAAPTGATLLSAPAVAPTVSEAPASGERVKASPLARRIAASKGVDLAALTGTGPRGRIVKADVVKGEATASPAQVAEAAPTPASDTAPGPQPAPTKPATIPDIPHELTKLSNMRKTIARRLTEAKQQVPHIYLTVDVKLDALLKLRGELNDALAGRVKVSVNDLLIKALALALIEQPKCNVMFTPDQLVSFTRADISVAVSTPAGLITPVVTEADAKSVSAIATEVKALAARARDGKLKPEEYTGGTASISNMGMYAITQFAAVINPPQAMILAVGAGEKRAWVEDDQLGIATVMTATGSFDHRAIDGADGAALMRAFKALVERPLGLLA